MWNGLGNLADQGKIDIYISVGLNIRDSYCFCFDERHTLQYAPGLRFCLIIYRNPVLDSIFFQVSESLRRLQYTRSVLETLMARVRLRLDCV